ncbi:MAG: DUF6514 family protein [Clostridia bacterium]|nr:DUF6514 family protein [Clostridia bacterium]
MEIDACHQTLKAEEGDLQVRYYIRKEDAGENEFHRVMYGIGAEYESEAYGNESAYVREVTSDEKFARKLFEKMCDMSVTPMTLKDVMAELL